jgi:SNF2 family DNA or RNA helicase
MPGPYFSKTRAYNHQVCALAKMMHGKGGALLMEPRTGKTKVAIDFCGRLYFQGLRRVLVIAPLTVLTVWEREIEKHLGNMVPRRVFRPEGGVTKRAKALSEMKASEDLTFVLVNYDSCWYPDLKKQLDAFKPQCVIADESHLIKNPTSRRSKAVASWRDAQYKLILTGTLITRSPLDIFGQWKFLKPGVLGDNWFRFQATYAVFGGYMNYEIVRYKNLEHLRRIIARDSYIISADECLQLPGRTYQDVEVVLQPSSRKVYDRMEKEFFLDLGGGSSAIAPIVLTKLLRLSQITGGFVVDQDGVAHSIGTEKLFALKELLQNYTYPDRKVVVFCRFLWEIEQIAAMCRENHIGAVTLTGSLSKSDRDQSIDSFRDDPKTLVFIAQISIGALGIDLSSAPIAIFYSRDFDYGHYTQACDRIICRGQKALYIHLIAKNTTDELDIGRSLLSKEDLSDRILEYRRRRTS